jgi:hypothetical protein
MDENAIQVRVEELADDGPLRMTAQNQKAGLGLFIARRIDHTIQHGEQLVPHLLPDSGGHVTGSGRRLGSLVRQITRQIASEMPDAALVLHPS